MKMDDDAADMDHTNPKYVKSGDSQEEEVKTLYPQLVLPWLQPNHMRNSYINPEARASKRVCYIGLQVWRSPLN